MKESHPKTKPIGPLTSAYFISFNSFILIEVTELSLFYSYLEHSPKAISILQNTLPKFKLIAKPLF